MHPLISIIVPVYNMEEYLSRCIDSILKQTYPNIEVIITDDGSTDKSAEICDQYACKDSRINVIHIRNTGSAAIPRNYGIEIAKGEWITFVDSDDYIDPDMIEFLYMCTKRTSCEMAICGVRHIGFPTANDNDIIKDSDKVYQGREAAKLVLIGGKGFSAASHHTLFRSDIIETIRFRNIRCFEDLEFSFLAALKSQKVCCNLGPPKYNYFYRKNNSSSSPLQSKLDDLNEVINAISQIAREIGPDLLEALQKRYVTNVLSILNDTIIRGKYRKNKEIWKKARAEIINLDINMNQFSKTEKIEYIMIKKGITQYTITCISIYIVKRLRTMIKKIVR